MGVKYFLGLAAARSLSARDRNDDFTIDWYKPIYRRLGMGT